MLVFLHPEADPKGAGFHIMQSLIAVGTAIYFMGARSEATTGIVATPALSPGGRGAVLLRGAF